MHGGVNKKELGGENVEALIQGIPNLEKHIESIKGFKVPYVVAINSFITDTAAETKALEDYLNENNHPYSLSEVWEKGGEGAVDLAHKVIHEINTKPNNFERMYKEEDTLKEKIEKVCTKIYGAKNVEFTSAARIQLRRFRRLGWDNLGVCMAKTQYSLSDNPKLLGRPEGFTITVKELRPSIGAGFIVALTGDVMTMPGLPKVPSALAMDIDDEGNAQGLF